MTHTAEQIRRTDTGPRPVPPIGSRKLTTPPVVVDTMLANGLRVLAVNDPSVPMIQVRLVIPFSHPDPRHSARASLLSRTLFAGTARRDRIATESALALVGGELSAANSPLVLGLGGWTISSGFDVMLDVLSDCLTGATYRDHEIEHERAQLLQQLAMARTQPDVIAHEALQRHRYGDHPLARELPSDSDVMEVTAEEVRDLHASAIVPRGSVVVVVGDIDPNHAVDKIDKATSDWTSSAVPAVLEPVPDITGGDIVVVHQPGAIQSHIRLTAQGMTEADARYPALHLANLAIGGYFSSRLNEHIREDKGYSYSVQSLLESALNAGSIRLELDTAAGTTLAAIREVRTQLDHFVTSPPGQDELDRVRRYATGNMLTSISSQQGLADRLAILAREGLGFDWLTAFLDQLDTLIPEDVATAAREFFPAARFTGVILGDADQLRAAEPQLDGIQLPANM